MDNLLNSDATTALILLGILIVSYGILRSIFFPAVKKLANRTSTFIDDLFLDKKFLNRLSYVVVFIIFNILTATPEFSIDLFSNVIVSRLIDATFALLVGLTILEVLSVPIYLSRVTKMFLALVLRRSQATEVMRDILCSVATVTLPPMALLSPH